MPRARKKQNNFEHVCEFCGKGFVRESSLVKHACNIKLRYMDSNLPKSRIGFMAFSYFYEKSMKKKARTLDEFIRSRYYGDFLAFGKYVSNNNIMYPEKFIDFLIRSGVPLHKWTANSIYEAYLRDLAKKESFEDGSHRTILLMKQWADENDEHYYDFFRKISPVQFVNYVRNGRISPWVLYTAKSGLELLENRLSEEQIGLIEEWIEPDYWARKLRVNKEDRKYYSKLFEEHGL